MKSTNRAIAFNSVKAVTDDDVDYVTKTEVMTQAWPFNIGGVDTDDDDDEPESRRHDEPTDSSTPLVTSARPRNTHRQQSDKLTLKRKPSRVRNKHTEWHKNKKHMARDDSNTNGVIKLKKHQRGGVASESESMNRKKWNTRKHRAQTQYSRLKKSRRYFKSKRKPQRLNPALVRLRNSRLGSYDLDRLRYHIYRGRGWKTPDDEYSHRYDDDDDDDDDDDEIRAWRRFGGLRSRKGPNRWRSAFGQ